MLTDLGVSGDFDVDRHTNLDNVSIAGFVTATKYFGDGSGLTGVVASGSGIVVKDDGSTVGTAGTVNFTSPITATPVSVGIVTVGINTVGFDVNKLSVSGISTFQNDITLASKIKHEGGTNTSFGFPENLAISFNTNNSERLRIGPLGQLGIAGANYGTSGQVLTSGGASGAVSWKGGGGLQVLEQFSSPADGSSFTTSNGTVTVQNPTDWQALNTTLTDAQGSVITYQPPTGTVQVIYEFQYHIASDTDSNAILGARLLYDGNEITHSRFGQRGGTNYFDQLNTFKWVFNIFYTYSRYRNISYVDFILGILKFIR